MPRRRLWVLGVLVIVAAGAALVASSQDDGTPSRDVTGDAFRPAARGRDVPRAGTCAGNVPPSDARVELVESDSELRLLPRCTVVARDGRVHLSNRTERNVVFVIAGTRVDVASFGTLTTPPAHTWLRSGYYDVEVASSDGRFVRGTELGIAPDD